MSDDIVTITKGTRVPYQDEYADGYQAYWAGKDQRSNPYKKHPQSDQCKMWKMGFLNAKKVEENGHTFGLDFDKMKEQYKSRHPNK